MSRDENLAENRVAKIAIGPMELERLLDLPEGVRIERLFVQHDPQMFVVAVSGPNLEPQPWDCCLPYLGGTWSAHHFYDRESGQMFIRWAWSPDSTPTSAEVETADAEQVERMRRRIQELERALTQAELRAIEVPGTTTRELLAEVATRMERTQNSLRGRDLAVLCREALENLDQAVLDRVAR